MDFLFSIFSKFQCFLTLKESMSKVLMDEAMYYVNSYTFFEQPENDWLKILKAVLPPADELTFLE